MLRVMALLLLMAAGYAEAQTSSTYSIDPDKINYAVINYADPPGANPPPVPSYVWVNASVGLNNRNFRDRPTFTSKATQKLYEKFMARKASMGNTGGDPHGSGGRPGAAGSSGAGADPGAVGASAGRRRRGLRATPLYSNGGGAGGGATTQTVPPEDGRTTASGGHGFGFGGVGLGRPITGTNQGFDGIGAPETRLIPEDLSLAVGNTGAIHTANSLMRFYRVDIGGKKMKHGLKDPVDSGSFLKQVWTADFFYEVTKLGDGSNGCDQGVYAATVAYDKWVGRYLVTAVCDDYLNPRILLAVSVVDSITDYWSLYSVPANNEPTSWQCFNGLRGAPDYTQVGYNRDGIFVSWVSICNEGVENPLDTQASAMLYAFPKWAVYGGNDPRLPLKRFWIPVWTGQDVCSAVSSQAPNRLPTGGDCGSAFVQLQPAMPQTAVDVRAGETFFVLDFYLDQASRRNFLLVSLIATGTLWDHEGLLTPTPFLVGRFVDRGEEAYIYDDVYLLQNQDAPNPDTVPVPDLDAGAVNPRGYWNGGAAFANGRIYIADRTDVVDPPSPPDTTGGGTDIYNPRPAIYWAWVQPTFTAYGPCACYWNFNWGYGWGWIWDKGCYNPMTGMMSAGGGGGYQRGRRLLGALVKRWAPWAGSLPAGDPVTPAGGLPPAAAVAAAAAAAAAPPLIGSGEGRKPWSGGERPKQSLLGKWGRRLMGTPFRSQSGTSFGDRDRSTIIPNGNASTADVTSSGSASGSWAGQAPRKREPNVVYSASTGAVAYTIRTQAPSGSRVITPPPGEVAAAGLRPEDVTPERLADVQAAVSTLDGQWGTLGAAGVVASGKEGGKLRDVYMTSAYYDPRMRSWGLEFRCRFTAFWNIKNTVTLLATVIKSGVITYGSASGQTDGPLGLAYPQVAVRGGTMLVTYTYSSPAVLDNTTISGVTFGDSAAYPGVGFTLINPNTKTTGVNVAKQQDPSYGPVVQLSQRFGDYAGIDIHPISGRIWSANLYTWAPAWTVTGDSVLSNAGARITIFS